MKKRTRQILNIGYPPRKSVFWASGLYPYEFFEAIGVVRSEEHTSELQSQR